MTVPLCATHTAFVYERGGTVIVGELKGIFDVRWDRRRDDMSAATVRFIPDLCCDLAGSLATVKQELHIFRDGVKVWEGPIVRIEYEFDEIAIFAKDILWVAKKRALEKGYNYLYGTGNPGAQPVIPHLRWTLGDMCYDLYGDEWNMSANLVDVTGPDDPVMSRAVNALSMSVWEDLDYVAQYYGVDYTVVNRKVYFFDTHLDWDPIDPIQEEWLSKHPRLTEYGQRYANRYVKTDGSGYAAQAEASSTAVTEYGKFMDMIANEVAQADRVYDGSDTPTVPTNAELGNWVEVATDRVADTHPPKLSIVIPANTSLLPSTTWDIDTLMPGSWFQANLTRQCVTVNEYQKLDRLRVEEDGEDGERVLMSSSTAPTKRVTNL